MGEPRARRAAAPWYRQHTGVDLELAKLRWTALRAGWEPLRTDVEWETAARKIQSGTSMDPVLLERLLDGGTTRLTQLGVRPEELLPDAVHSLRNAGSQAPSFGHASVRAARQLVDMITAPDKASDKQLRSLQAHLARNDDTTGLPNYGELSRAAAQGEMLLLLVARDASDARAAAALASDVRLPAGAAGSSRPAASNPELLRW